MAEVLKEGDDICPPTSVVGGDFEVISVEVVVTDSVVSFVVPTVLPGKLDAGRIPKVVRGVLLTIERGEVVVSPDCDVV